MLWIGDRTRQPDGAHAEYFAGIRNPIGIKCGPSLSTDDLLRLLDRLNPTDDAGRITLIARFGADKIAEHLPRLIEAVQPGRADRGVVLRPDARQHHQGVDPATRRGRSATGCCSGGARVSSRCTARWAPMPGGIHIEMTGDDVTECVGGAVGGDRGRPQGPLPHLLRPPPSMPTRRWEMAFLVAEEIPRPAAGTPSGNHSGGVGVGATAVV